MMYFYPSHDNDKNENIASKNDKNVEDKIVKGRSILEVLLWVHL